MKEGDTAGNEEREQRKEKYNKGRNIILYMGWNDDLLRHNGV